MGARGDLHTFQPERRGFSCRGGPPGAGRRGPTHRGRGANFPPGAGAPSWVGAATPCYGLATSGPTADIRDVEKQIPSHLLDHASVGHSGAPHPCGA